MFPRAFDEHGRSEPPAVGDQASSATVDARRNLAFVREIERVMIDPQAREAERRRPSPSAGSMTGGALA